VKVLIVDDSAILRERIIRTISEIPGVEIVGEAETSQEAIEAIQDRKPDVVLLDIRLRVGNGIDVLHAVKQSESPPVVIVFTGYPYPQYRKRCEEEGADYFFSKKDDFEKLVEVLKELTLK